MYLSIIIGFIDNAFVNGELEISTRVTKIVLGTLHLRFSMVTHLKLISSPDQKLVLGAVYSFIMPHLSTRRLFNGNTFGIGNFHSCH